MNLDVNLVRVTGKGEKERMVPLGTKAADITRQWKDRGRPGMLRNMTSPYLFVARAAGQ